MADTKIGIEAYRDDHAETLRRLFELTASNCVHCHPVDLGTFAETLGGKTESVLDERVFVSVDSGRPTGFSHAVIRNPKDVEGHCGAIRFLCYEPGDRPSGLALLHHTVS